MPSPVPGVRFRPLCPPDVASLIHLIVTARADDGPHEPITPDEIRHAWFDHPGMDMERDTVVAVTPDEQVVGISAALAREAPVRFGRIYVPGTVRADFRRRGIGRELLRRTDERAQEMLRAWEGDMERWVNVETPAGLAGRIALFESEGFSAVRTFATMHRDLGPTDAPLPADPPMPDGFTATTWRADLNDQTRLAHNDAFRDHWGSEPINAERWRFFAEGSPNFRADCSWLAVDGATIAGYVMSALTPERDGNCVGWLGTIGVRRGYRGRGLASALIARSLTSFLAAGASTVGLDVDTDNLTGATRLYASLGFRTTEESLIYAKHVER